MGIIVRWNNISATKNKMTFKKANSRNQICQFKLKFGTYTNSNTQNSMAVFTFSVFDPKYLLSKFGPKIQDCLKWNLVPKLIRIFRIKWWCWLFLFSTRHTLLGQIWSKKSNIFNLRRIHRIQCCSFFPFLTCRLSAKNPFGILVLPD